MNQERTENNAQAAKTPSIKAVTRIPAPEDYLQRNPPETPIKDALNNFLGTLRQKLVKLQNGGGEIVIKNYPVFLTKINSEWALVQDYRRAILHISDVYWSHSSSNAVAQNGEDMPLPRFPWRFPDMNEALRLFENKSYLGCALPKGALQVGAVTIALNSSPSQQHRPEFALQLSNKAQLRFNGNAHQQAVDIRMCYVGDVSPVSGSVLTLPFLLNYNLIPDNLTSAEEEAFQCVNNLLQKKYLQITEASTFLLKKELQDLPEAKRRELTAPLTQSKQTDGDAPRAASELESAIDAVLKLDEIRANITPEQRQVLTDPRKGLWELWEDVKPGYVSVESSAPLYARDPRQDILKSGVIGIDFGTKSTVVMRMDGESYGERILPVRVGTGRYEQPVSKSDFENPTVMEFINLERFRQAYCRNEGRPLTRWEDLTVSHAASDRRIQESKADYAAAYFGELKEWAGGAQREMQIRDKRASDESLPALTLPNYLSLSDGDIDPIEYYAYYIGLYINNMRTGHIYLEYILSYPATFSLEIRERIRKSFERGLRKSLPETVLHDPACMENFSVREGPAEPVAYAVCALQEYGFYPEAGKKAYFGVFDFGGGTADFDFGYWRKAEPVARERRYRYVIRHFGATGDRFLGGENLLEELANRVFWENSGELLKNGVQFTLSPEGEERVGYEALIDNTMAAQTNTRLLMNTLRPFWEESEADPVPDSEDAAQSGELFEEGFVELELLDKSNQQKTVRLSIDKDALTAYLRERLERGVENFLHAMSTSLGSVMENEDFDKVNIFLAGNSCKSSLLREIFSSKLRDFDNVMLQHQGHASREADEEFQYIKLFYPLGSSEAEAYLRENGLERNGNAYRPNGKTGVAYGLLLGRPGGRIKMEEDVGEKPFRYWVGMADETGFFEALLSPSSPYGVWEELYDAGEETFEFSQTSSPAAQRSGVIRADADAVRSVRRKLPSSAVNADWLICLRPVKPDMLEYAVAESAEAANSGQFRYGPVPVTLNS